MQKLAVFLTISLLNVLSACGGEAESAYFKLPSLQDSEEHIWMEPEITEEIYSYPDDEESSEASSEITYFTSHHFGYVGDLTNPTVTCRNWIVGIEPEMVTYVVPMTFVTAANYWTGETILDPGSYYCDVSGYVSGVTQYVFQPQPPNGTWGYREESYLWVNGYFFPQIGCYVGAGTVLNAVTVTTDHQLIVPADPTMNGISCH